MKTTLLIVLLALVFTQSYSKDFGEIEIDEELQVKYSDSLKKTLENNYLESGSILKNKEVMEF